MYRFVRERGTGSIAAHSHFRRERDDLFREHPQSPLDVAQKAAFAGLRYYEYDPDYRIVAVPDVDVELHSYEMDLGDDGQFTILPVLITRVGCARWPRRATAWTFPYLRGSCFPVSEGPLFDNLLVWSVNPWNSRCTTEKSPT